MALRSSAQRRCACREKFRQKRLMETIHMETRNELKKGGDIAS